MSRKTKFIYALSIIPIIIVLTIGIKISNENDYKKLKKQYYEMFNNKDIVKKGITQKNLVDFKRSSNKIIGHNNEKKKFIKSIDNTLNYINLNNVIKSETKNNIISSTLNRNKINYLKQENSKLPNNYQNYINNYIIELEIQRNNIDAIEEKINSLYKNDEEFRDDISYEEIENYRLELITLPQQDIVDKNLEIIYAAAIYLNNKEEIERQRQEEETRKLQEEINNAWVILRTPYISQNKNGILNGCEAAAMLMALNYKGILQGTSLYDYSVNMPKSPNNNAYEGFTHDIFGLDPLTIPHWIAPAPLAEYGRSSSGYGNIIDGTGMSLSQLDQELENGNPVIIYVTAFFNPPKEWVEGAPTNLHVQLLTGYNRITGEHLIIDPWTHDNGRTSWTMSREITEARYDAVGRKCVIIR